METPLAKVRERDDDDDDVGSDRISRLPDSVLHHILCFLSHKKAFQTCVLSKSWRHLGPTRPVIDIRGYCEYRHVSGINGVCEFCFLANQEAFDSVVDNTFQRYHDQNLFPRELRLDVWNQLQSTSVLQKWIPIFVNPDRHVTTFRLSFFGSPCFNLPSVVFKVESLQELSLKGCMLHEINSIEDNFVLKKLQKLFLSRVDVSDEALEKVISGCPSVKCVVILNCKGFKTINIGTKNRYLKRFEFSSYSGFKSHVPSIEIEAPTLESIRIVGNPSDETINCYPNNINYYFPHLKSLFLSQLNISTQLFHNISCNFPHLQELTLHDCRGFKEIELSSCSIKRLIIKQPNTTLLIKKVAIEVPNIRYFEFSYKHLPTTVSLMTTSREWKSHLELNACLYAYSDNEVLQRILNVFRLVKSLSQSQISLTVYEAYYFKINKIEWDFNDNPVEVENLGLNVSGFCPDSFAHFVNALFRIFRPRYTNAVPLYNNDDVKVTECLWKTLIHEREKTEHGWEQHLEEVSIEAFDEEGEVWYHVEGTCLQEWSWNQKIRFRLKWKD